MLDVDQKMAAASPIIDAADKRNKITVKGLIIDIVSIPAFLILFVIAILYAGILWLFRVE